jgi:hypothetical protein
VLASTPCLAGGRQRTASEDAENLGHGRWSERRDEDDLACGG